MTPKATTEEFLEIKRLELLKELMHGPKKDEKKEKDEKKPKPWFEKEMTLGAFVKAFLLAMLLYPIVGAYYVTLINKIWQISIH
jgi:hypothetical protein